MARWRLGRAVIGAVTGSMRERSMRARVVLPLLGGPWRIRIGYGPLGRRAARSQSRTAEEVRMPGREVENSGVSELEGCGCGSGSWPRVLRKVTPGVKRVICQPCWLISTASERGLARSMKMGDEEVGREARATRRQTLGPTD